MLGALWKYLSTWEKFLKQSGQQHVDKLIFGKMKTDGSNDARSFCLAMTVLHVWKLHCIKSLKGQRYNRT